MAKNEEKTLTSFEKRVLEMYNEGIGSPTIAKELGTYSSKITRTLKKLGVKLRDRSEAQSAYLNSTDNHPTKGKKRPLEVRKKISKGVHKTWKNKPEEEKEAMREKMREIWNSQPESLHEERRKAAHEAIRKASVEGSRIEQFLLIALRDFGYRVDFHRKGLVPNTNLELDLFLPGLKTVIEIDGPTHFKPIWGEEKLQKNIQSDAEKSGLILACGYCMIRVKYDTKYWSEIQAQTILEKILEILSAVEEEFPEKEYRYIEIEG